MWKDVMQTKEEKIDLFNKNQEMVKIDVESYNHMYIEELVQKTFNFLMDNFGDKIVIVDEPVILYEDSDNRKVFNMISRKFKYFVDTNELDRFTYDCFNRAKKIFLYIIICYEEFNLIRYYCMEDEIESNL